jgi:hypothetical protein
MVQDMQEFMPQQENNTGGFLFCFPFSSFISFVSSLPHISTASHFPFSTLQTVLWDVTPCGLTLNVFCATRCGLLPV